MHRLILGFVCLSAAIGLPIYAAEPTVDTATWLRFIALELRQFRLEFLEHRMTEEAARIPRLERELSALRIEQRNKQSEERLQTQQAADLEKQGSDSSADAQARGQIQAARNELASGAEITRAAQGSLKAREAELNERLRTTKARLQSIADRLKQLSVPER